MQLPIGGRKDMELPLNKIDEFIQTHLERDFSLTDISSAAGYSPYHLSREYKKLTGKNFDELCQREKNNGGCKKNIRRRKRS